MGLDICRRGALAISDDRTLRVRSKEWARVRARVGCVNGDVVGGENL